MWGQDGKRQHPAKFALFVYSMECPKARFRNSRCCRRSMSSCAHELLVRHLAANTTAVHCRGQARVLTAVLLCCPSGAVRTPQAVPAVLTAKASAAVTASSPRQQQQHVLASPVKPAAASTGVFKDASSEIADIDQRLHALQNFLKAAKSSVSAA